MGNISKKFIASKEHFDVFSNMFQKLNCFKNVLVMYFLSNISAEMISKHTRNLTRAERTMHLPCNFGNIIKALLPSYELNIEKMASYIFSIFEWFSPDFFFFFLTKLVFFFY